MKKRFGSILLAFAMALTLLPWTAIPASAGEKEPEIMLGTSGIEFDDIVYFGQQSTSNNLRMWRVLSPAGETLPVSGENRILLLSVCARQEIGFGASNQWANSPAQMWCKLYYSGDSFSDTERAAIAETSVEEIDDVSNDVRYHETPCQYYNGQFYYGAASLENEHVFFLSAKEAAKIDFSGKKALTENNSPVAWWLRSPEAKTDNSVGLVDAANGYLSRGNVGKADVYARPACNLDADSVLLMQAAYNAATGDSGAIKAIASTGSIYQWKLTLLDESRSGISAVKTAADVNTHGGTVTLSYTGAKTGSSEYVSVLLCGEDGRALGYGVSAPLSKSSGTVTFTLPSLGQTGHYKLYVFNEQRNAKFYSNYASAFQEVELPVTGINVRVDGDELCYDLGGAPSNALLIAARYDGGKMTDVQTVDLQNAVNKSDTLTMRGTGSAFKLMLVDKTTYAPLCNAWES